MLVRVLARTLVLPALRVVAWVQQAVLAQAQAQVQEATVEA